jgi:hypothetical protein
MTDAVARFRSVISRCLDAFPDAPFVVCRREGKHDGPITLSAITVSNCLRISTRHALPFARIDRKTMSTKDPKKLYKQPPYSARKREQERRIWTMATRPR